MRKRYLAALVCIVIIAVTAYADQIRMINEIEILFLIENGETFSPLDGVAIDIKLPGMNDYERFSVRSKDVKKTWRRLSVNVWGDDYYSAWLFIGSSSAFHREVNDIAEPAYRYRSLSEGRSFRVDLRFSKSGFVPEFRSVVIAHKDGKLVLEGDYGTGSKIEYPGAYNPNVLIYQRVLMNPR